MLIVVNDRALSVSRERQCHGWVLVRYSRSDAFVLGARWGSNALASARAERIVGDLLKAELVDKAARSIKYQLTIAKLPLAKALADFEFNGTPITRPWSAILPPAASAPNSATSCWRAKPKRASSPCHRDRSLLQWCPRPVLQCRRFGQPARSREPQRPGLRRLSDPHRLPAVCPVRWPATLPPAASVLGTELSGPRSAGAYVNLIRFQVILPY